MVPALLGGSALSSGRTILLLLLLGARDGVFDGACEAFDGATEAAGLMGTTVRASDRSDGATLGALPLPCLLPLVRRLTRLSALLRRSSSLLLLLSCRLLLLQLVLDSPEADAERNIEPILLFERDLDRPDALLCASVPTSVPAIVIAVGAR